MSEYKVLIKMSAMSEVMNQEALKCAKQALEKYSTNDVRYISKSINYILFQVPK